MPKPTEVVLVTPKSDKPAQSLLRAFVLLWIWALINGFELMFLVPLAHRVLGTPALLPGYWDCVLIAYLTRAVIKGLTGSVIPTASEK